MKVLYGISACLALVCGFDADMELIQIMIEHPHGIVGETAMVSFWAITAMAVALWCILVYLSRHED